MTIDEFGMEIPDPTFIIEYGDYGCGDIAVAEIKKSERRKVRKTGRKIIRIINTSDFRTPDFRT
jgi:hypothetical protein